MANHRTLWWKNFTTVAAKARRPARYALQLLLNEPSLRERLSDPDFLGPLWQLILPLLNPQAVKVFLARPSNENESNDENCDWGHEMSHPEQNDILRPRLSHFFETLPRQVLDRLVKDDGEAPIDSTVALLCEGLGLDAIVTRFLDFMEQRMAVNHLSAFLRQTPHMDTKTIEFWLAAILGCDKSALDAAIPNGPEIPVIAGLLDNNNDSELNLESVLKPSNLFTSVLEAAPKDADSLLATLIQPAPAASWRLEDFPHLADEIENLRDVMQQAVATGAVGVNALFHGAVGSGKTEMALTLAEACGLKAYRIRGTNNEGLASGDQPLGDQPLGYLLAHGLLVRRRDSLLIFDEVEDVMECNNDFISFLLCGRPAS
ncbi:MAG: AAA family ATPase, partial [Pseudomonadota bacterium]